MLKMIFLLIALTLLLCCKEAEPIETQSPLPTQAKPANEKIVLGCSVAWPPYYGPELQEGGVLTVLSQEAFKRRGYELKVHYMPWARAVEEVKQGHYALLFAPYFTEERNQFMHYTDGVIVETVSGIVLLEDSKLQVNTLEDLRGKRVGQMRGSFISESYDRADFFDKHLVATEASVVDLLLEGRVSAIAGDISIFRHILSQSEQDKGKKLKQGPILQRGKIFNAFSRKRPEAQKLRDEFDKGLQEIIADGTYTQILQRFKMESINSTKATDEP